MPAGFDHRPVIAANLGEEVRVHVGVKPHRKRPYGTKIDHFGKHGVSQLGIEVPVEAVVVVKDAPKILMRNGLLMVVLDRDELGHGLRFQWQGHRLDSSRLQQHPHRVDLLDTLWFEVAHRGTFIALPIDEPGLLER